MQFAWNDGVAAPSEAPPEDSGRVGSELVPAHPIQLHPTPNPLPT